MAFANQNSRLRVAREMYSMRFPAEDVSALNMQQLRGREGARVRRIYREESERTGVPWGRRDYDPSDFAGSDPINQALTAAHTCLYGIVHAVIVAMGCSPGLGFVHTGHVRSFVYDMADLYKAQITIPIAFQVISNEPEDIPAETRRAVRDAVHDGKIFQRCASDLRKLLLPDEDSNAELFDVDVVELWDGAGRTVAAGTQYNEELPW